MYLMSVIGASALLAVVTVQAGAFEPIVSMPGADREIYPNGVTADVLATKEQTDGQFGAIVLRSNGPKDGPGPAIVNSKNAEAWYVLDGVYEFHIGDKVFEGGQGTFVVADKGQAHGFISKTAGSILTIYAPAGYEHFFIDWDKQKLTPGPDLGKLEQSYGVTRP